MQGLSALGYLAGNDDFEDTMLAENGVAVVLAASKNHAAVSVPSPPHTCTPWAHSRSN